MALIITVKQGESFYVGTDVKITPIAQKGKQIKFAIDAPRNIEVDRESVRESKNLERGIV